MGTRVLLSSVLMSCRDHPHAYGDKIDKDKAEKMYRDHPHAYGDKLH